MSHFTVMVIGADVAKQLAPFHEFECTGENDEFVKDIDETDEAKADFERNKDDPDYPTFATFVDGYYGRPKVEHGQQPDKEGEHKFGYYTVTAEGEVDKVIRRTNPDKQWDWYVVGGRWSGLLKLKGGANERADSARKGDVDFDAMRNGAGMEAADAWDKFHAVVAGRPFPVWKDIMARHPGNTDAAREEYRANPVVVDLRAADLLGWHGIDHMNVDRETFIRRARNSAGVTFAVLKDGQWSERGRMGWWGMVADEKDEDTWNVEFAKLMDSLSDDTLLTVVDCHI